MRSTRAIVGMVFVGALAGSPSACRPASNAPAANLPSSPGVAPVLASFTASPLALASGVATDVHWEWSYANMPSPTPSCVLSPGVGAVVSGAVTTLTLSTATTFTLTCANATGADTASVTPSLVPRVVRFSEEFGPHQGGGGFGYQQFDGATYADLVWDAASARWQGSTQYLQIGPGWLHPHQHEVALAWKAPVAGTVTIRGHMERADANGDGVRTRIVKNGARIWPSSGEQELFPRLSAQHVLVVDVAAQDLIHFHVEQKGDFGFDTTFWDPEISYAAPPRLTTDKVEVSMRPADVDAMQMTFVDASLSTIYRGPTMNNLWFHTFADTSQRFAGPLDAPATSLLFAGQTTSLISNPTNADGRLWLSNVYQHEDGSILGFVHVEEAGVAHDKMRLGLAYSTDLGVSWTYLGHIISLAGDESGYNITGAPYFVKDATFYVYFLDVGYVAAVARAPVAEVIAAAKSGGVSPWKKFAGGEWTEAGLAGASTNPGVPDFVTLHGDAAYSTTKGTYILTGYSHQDGRGVWIGFSSEGLDWRAGEFLQRGGLDNKTLSPYVTVVNADGTDNSLVGDSFFVYWGFNPRWDDPVCTINAPHCETRYLLRQKVTLIAP